MGLADDKLHRQTNFFLGLPVYFCLGVYYCLKFLASPVLLFWNKTSDTIYNTVNKNDTNDLSGAILNGAEVATKVMSHETAATLAASSAIAGVTGNNLLPEDAEGIKANNVQQQAPNNAAQDANQTAKAMAAGAGTITHAPIKKQIRVSEKLLQERENLINLIDSGEEIRSDRPVTYRYTALNPEGKQVTNSFTAFSKVEVYTFLENEGYKVFKIETNKFIEKMYGTGVFASRKIKTKDIVFWLQQLSTYLKAGIPLTDSMRILSKQMGKNDNIKRTFDSVVYNLTLGENFSSCLEKQGNAFPSLLINMVKSAEATGDLEGTLDEMADYYAATESTRKEMVSALTYPVMVMLFSLGVVVFILVYLIPQFQNIYNTAGVTLNPITQFIISASEFLQDNLVSILIVIVLIVAALLILYKNIKAFRYFMQTLFMKIPVIGNIIIYKEMMIFTKTFSSLLKNNVFITESMDILGKVTNNEIYREIMINTINYIGRGEKISEAFKNHWAIPEVAYYMMVTGESTGELAEMMGKVSDYYAEQHKMIIDSMKSLIEPILIIFLAVVVGGIIIAVIVPMFSLYSNIL